MRGLRRPFERILNRFLQPAEFPRTALRCAVDQDMRVVSAVENGNGVCHRRLVPDRNAVRIKQPGLDRPAGQGFLRRGLQLRLNGKHRVRVRVIQIRPDREVGDACSGG